MAVLSTVAPGPTLEPTRGTRSRRDGCEAVVRRELPPAHRDADLSGLDEEDLLDHARTLHALRTECGCRVGELGVLVMMLVALADIALVRHPHSSVAAVAALVELGVAALLGGGVGKVAGILTARTRYVLRVRRLDPARAAA